MSGIVGIARKLAVGIACVVAITTPKFVSSNDLPQGDGPKMSLDVDVPMPPPVKVIICTEALCPDCQEFVGKQVVKTFQKLGSTVMDLQLVPFGNAQIDLDKKEIKCQHGNGECDANAWEQCAIYENPEVEKHLPFIACLDDTLPPGSHEDRFDETIFKSCAEQNDMDFLPIKTCHDVEKVYWDVAVHFSELTPDDHEYVPWVVIDGNHMDPDEESLMEQVCKVYKANGGSHEGCDSLVEALDMEALPE